MKFGFIERISYGLIVAGLSLWSVAAVAQDYLDSELRIAVTRLQQDAASPTTLANYPQRSDVLWRWANAYAVSGGYVPVNLTAVARIKLPDPPLPATLRAQLNSPRSDSPWSWSLSRWTTC